MSSKLDIVVGGKEPPEKSKTCYCLGAISRRAAENGESIWIVANTFRLREVKDKEGTLRFDQ
jgi:hypothetical protein